MRHCYRLSFILLFMSTFGLSQTTLDSSAESGTLIIAVRMKASVVIGVDSKVSQNPSNEKERQKFPINSQRKLVDVGRFSACALDGNLGIEGNSKLDVASAMRSWTTRNPNAEIDTALTPLLLAAASAWNGRKFTQLSKLPNGRRPGDPITTLTCGGWIKGDPIILRGRTIVNGDSSAGHEILKPIGPDIFYIDGVFDTPYFFRSYMMNPPPDKLSADVFAKIRSDFAASLAFGGISHGIVPAQEGTPSIKSLFGAIFSAVEQDAPNIVGKPNQIRVISRCGRVKDQVDSSEWKACTK
jgi:hypothetical protein